MGALSQLYLQKITKEPTFLVDLVDMEVTDDTGVVWHCGQAPFSMRNPSYSIEATVHTNRLKPLLFQFPLKKGEITLFRITQSCGVIMYVWCLTIIGFIEMIYIHTAGTIDSNGVTLEIKSHQVPIMTAFFYHGTSSKSVKPIPVPHFWEKWEPMFPDGNHYWSADLSLVA